MKNTTTVTQAFQISKTFNLDVNPSISILGKEQRSKFVPAIDPDFSFQKELMSQLMAWFKLGKSLGDSLLITGPTGCGKSSVITQVAARLNWDLSYVTGYSEMQVSEVIGSKTIIDGDVVWQDGPLTTAMRYGHIFLFDEMDMVSPSVVAAMGAVLEGRPLVLGDNGGEIVEPHPDFLFVFTGNSNGSGDDTGAYQGVFQQNMAMMDRCWVIQTSYMPKQDEIKVLTRKVPDFSEEAAELLVNLASDIRNGFLNGDLSITCSTRTLIRWATMAVFYLKPAQQKKVSSIELSMPMALSNRAKPEEAEALIELARRHFPSRG